MVLSVFGGRLVQLQGIDPHSYAAMAAAENVVDVVLPAERGEILDRDGEALADSSDGLMVLADPKQTKKDAPAIAAFLAKELGVDYASALAKLRKDGSRFQYIKRQVPATQATAAVEKAGKEGYQGLWTSRDPLRNYPNGDVAANLVGFLGNDEGPLAGLEAAFDKHLAGKDGQAYDATSPVSGTRMPLGTNNRVDPVDGNDLRLTIDRDLQYYVQQTLMDAVQKSRAESGMAVVMDTQTGEILPGRLPDLRRPRPGRLAEVAAREQRPLQRLRARLGAEGAHRRRPARPGARLALDPAQGAGVLSLGRCRHPRLVRARHGEAHPGRGDREVLQHRHRDGREQVRGRPTAGLPGRLRLRVGAPASASTPSRPVCSPRRRPGTRPTRTASTSASRSRSTPCR